VMEATPSPAGSGAATDLFTEFDPLAANARERLPLVGLSVGGEPSQAEQIRHVEAARQNGMTDQEIRESLDGNRTYPAELHAAAKREWERLSGDPEFRRRLFDGDADAARKWRAYATIVSGGVKG
jgi:hypothetical protein